MKTIYLWATALLCTLFLWSGSFAAAGKDAEQLDKAFSRSTLQIATPDARLHKIDVWIARFDDVADMRLHREVLFEDSYVVVANVQSPWSRRRKLTLQDLLDEAWALPPLDNRVGSYLAQAFRACGLEYPRVTVTTTSPETRFGLLAMGRYLTMMPTFALRFPARRPEFKVLPLSLPLAAVPVSIVTLKDRALSPAAEHFIETAREVARPLQRGTHRLRGAASSPASIKIRS